jgi:hypothetical protein
MIRWSLVLVPAIAVAFALAAPGGVPVDVSSFGDSTHHWRNIKEPERVMQPLPGQPSFRPDQVREITAMCCGSNA